MILCWAALTAILGRVWSMGHGWDTPDGKQQHLIRNVPAQWNRPRGRDTAAPVVLNTEPPPLMAKAAYSLSKHLPAGRAASTFLLL